MAASTVSSNSQSYSSMSKGDVEAIGAHCQTEYCNILDFLPFKCASCKGMYCLDHRTEDAHKCSRAGEWARKQSTRNASDPLPPKPSLLSPSQPCPEPSCQTIIDTLRSPAVHCSTCNRSYCLKHRMGEAHNCTNLKPIGARPKTVLEQQRERGMTALTKLKIWAENKKAEEANKKVTLSGFLGFGSKKASTTSTAQAEVNALKKAAKGDKSIPQGKRVYLNVEASADTTKANFPTGKFFYNQEWTVGRVLDVAAKALQVENVNNRGGGEEDKLRIFHVEGGRLLKFSEKIGSPCANGNMIVLLRGVGSGEIDLIDL